VWNLTALPLLIDQECRIRHAPRSSLGLVPPVPSLSNALLVTGPCRDIADGEAQVEAKNARCVPERRREREEVHLIVADSPVRIEGDAARARWRRRAILRYQRLREAH
jgi:hypothetical protein